MKSEPMPVSSESLEWERIFFRTAGLFLEARWNDLHEIPSPSLGAILGEMDARTELLYLVEGRQAPGWHLRYFPCVQVLLIGSIIRTWKTTASPPK